MPMGSSLFGLCLQSQKHLHLALLVTWTAWCRTSVGFRCLQVPTALQGPQVHLDRESSPSHHIQSFARHPNGRSPLAPFLTHPPKPGVDVALSTTAETTTLSAVRLLYPAT